MTKPEIIGGMRSSYTRVVCMACEEKSIDYTLTETLLGASELRALHPLGRMPVLRHDGFVLFESKAIATYLDKSFPGPELIPSEPRLLGLVEQWVSYVNTVVDPILVRTYLLAYALPNAADGKPDRVLIDAVLPRVREQLEILDRAVVSGHLAGDRFTFADINLLPILFYLRQLPESGEALSRSANLARYYERHAARPSFTRTVPPLGPPERAR
jgi:glutathione S-transferase